MVTVDQLSRRDQLVAVNLAREREPHLDGLFSEPQAGVRNGCAALAWCALQIPLCRTRRIEVCRPAMAPGPRSLRPQDHPRRRRGRPGTASPVPLLPGARGASGSGAGLVVDETVRRWRGGSAGAHGSAMMLNTISLPGAGRGPGWRSTASRARLFQSTSIVRDGRTKT